MVEVNEMGKQFLEKTRKTCLELFPGSKILQEKFTKMSYDDLIIMLHGGFSEKALIQSLQGIFERTLFEYSKEDLEAIEKGIDAVIKTAKENIQEG